MKVENMAFVPDLSHIECHVCGAVLQRDLTRDKEWCTNEACLLFGHEFNVSYKREDVKKPKPADFERKILEV